MQWVTTEQPVRRSFKIKALIHDNIVASTLSPGSFWAEWAGDDMTT